MRPASLYRFAPWLPWGLSRRATTPAPRDGPPIIVAPGSPLWLGDSLTAYWLSDGRASWPGGCNRGVPGDRTEHLLWRLAQVPAATPQPAAVVLMIGANNLDRDAPPCIAAGVAACVGAVRRLWPTAPLFLLGLLPVGPRWTPLTRRAVPSVNRRLARLGCPFLDPGPAFLDPSGEVRPELLPSIHLSAAGYAALAAAVHGPVAAYASPATTA